MLGAVAAEALEQAAQHEIAVALEHHVDEVDDDDPADVAQPQLTHHLFGGLEVVAGDGLLEVAARPDELAGVDVDDRHSLGAVDDERPAAGQPDLAVHRLQQLLVDAVLDEHVGVRRPATDPVGQIGCHVGQIGLDDAPGGLAADDQRGEVLVEHVAHDADREVGLAVQQLGRGAPRRRGRPLLDLGPLLGQPLDVLRQLVLAGPLSRGAHDHPGLVGDDGLEDALEPGALGVGQLAADAGHRVAGDEDEVAAGQRHLAGQPGALVAHRVLGHLDEHGVAGLQRHLDPARLPVHAGGVPVDLTGIQDGVAALADVDERGLHAGQHVLHPAEVDVADHRGVRLVGDVVLDQDGVLEHRDLGAAGALAHHHRALHALAAGQELGLGDGRLAPAGVAPVPAALLLGLEPGRAAHRGDLVLGLARLPHPGDGVRRVVRGLGLSLARTRPATAAAPAAAGRRPLLVALGVTIGLVVGLGVGLGVGLVVRLAAVRLAAVTGLAVGRVGVRGVG